MKFKFLFLVLFMTYCELSAQNILKVRIVGLHNNTACLRVALYNSPENFPVAGKEFKTITKTADKTCFIFKNLPPGKYALAVLHNENKNNAPDKQYWTSRKKVLVFPKMQKQY